MKTKFKSLALKKKKRSHLPAVIEIQSHSKKSEDRADMRKCTRLQDLATVQRLSSSARSETAIDSLSTCYQTGDIFFCQHSENFKQLIYDSLLQKINSTFTRR